MVEGNEKSLGCLRFLDGINGPGEIEIRARFDPARREKWRAMTVARDAALAESVACGLFARERAGGFGAGRALLTSGVRPPRGTAGQDVFTDGELFAGFVVDEAAPHMFHGGKRLAMQRASAQYCALDTRVRIWQSPMPKSMRPRSARVLPPLSVADSSRGW